MDKFQAAFEILYLLSCVDGEVDSSEIQVIKNFLDNNYNSISFVPSEVINSVDMLNSEGMFEELVTAVNIFKNYSSAVERNNLLQFAIELVVADGHVSSSEKELLYAIANTWNLDLNRFLSQYA